MTMYYDGGDGPVEYGVDGEKIDRRDKLIRDQKSRIWELERDKRVVELGLKQEAQLREKHPGLSELWDQYQTMLMLCRRQERSFNDDDAADGCG